MLKTALLAMSLVFGAGFAHAATFTSDFTCSVSDVTGSDACFGMADGNAQQADLNGDTFGSDDGLFGYDDWNSFQIVGSVGGDQKSGSFDVIGNMYDQVAVLLKSSNEFAAYLFEDGFEGTLFFSTANNKGLSNYIVAGRLGDTPPPSEVPLPAAGFLLLGGLGGLMVLRRKKS